ncbi:MAG: segregation and condensation protein A [Syntrophomonadaceae bacterium]|jgi:segregation and condensation protein A
MEYVVDLEVFHGPLDLLLYLVKKNEVDIYDIPIAIISDQYMEYLQVSGNINLGHLEDFLLMASYLLSIKSKLLLPANVIEPEDTEETSDPRQELVEKLIIYKRFKEAAVWLDNQQNEVNERIYYRPIHPGEELIPEIIADKKSLVKAYKAVLRNASQLTPNYSLPSDDINVSKKMNEILFRLKQEAGIMVFQDLFVGTCNRREILASFLALLELIRLQQVEAIQLNAFDMIKLKLKVVK